MTRSYFFAGIFYASPGAIVAAAMMSAPGRVGGNSNWDYRYCWLRDTGLTMGALFSLGYTA